MNLNEYDYELPKELIAKYPQNPRLHVLMLQRYEALQASNRAEEAKSYADQITSVLQPNGPWHRAVITEHATDAAAGAELAQLLASTRIADDLSIITARIDDGKLRSY